MKKEKKCDKIKKTGIGGQAVIEGVMMRGERSMATAVRDEDGIIRVESKRIKPQKEKKLFFRLPIIRGVVNFGSSLAVGTKTLMRSAEGCIYTLGADLQPGGNFKFHSCTHWNQRTAIY